MLLTSFDLLNQAKSKLCKPQEAARSRCRSSVPLSNSSYSLHDRTCQSQQCLAVHLPLLHHGHWYIQRCKLLGRRWKIQYNKSHRLHLRPALPLMGSHRCWYSASRPIHTVSPLLGVHHVHRPKESNCASGVHPAQKSTIHNTRVSHQNYSQGARLHIPCTESDALVESLSRMPGSWNIGYRHNLERNNTWTHLSSSEIMTYHAWLFSEWLDQKWPKCQTGSKLINWSTATWILIEFLPPHHIVSDWAFWKAPFPCISSLQQAKGCLRHD